MPVKPINSTAHLPSFCHPNQTFAGFIAVGSKIATDKEIAAFQGKIIGITGKIELHGGKPEIKVLSISQIKVVDHGR